jgi:DNA-directed RNA polymerase specialized sigma24 family protein
LSKNLKKLTFSLRSVIDYNKIIEKEVIACFQIFGFSGVFLMTKRYDSTSFGGTNSQFQTTEWTKILNSSIGESILGELYNKYSKPLYSYLRRKGFNNDQAKDLVHGFFCEKVLGQQLIQKADRTKGKFRTFLLTAIQHYAIDIHRKSKPLKQLDEEIERPSDANDPETEFVIAFVKELIHSVLIELEEECKSKNKMTHWHIFRLWLLEPDISTKKTNMKAICAKFNINDVDKAYNMISNIKERFIIIFRRRLSHYLASETEIDEEIKFYIEIFSKYSTR